MNKKELRQQIRERKKKYTAKELAELSTYPLQRLLRHPRIEAADTIMIYYSLPDEVDTHEVIEILRQKGKRILLPVVIGSEEMEVREYLGTQNMSKNDYNILEPSGKSFTALKEIDIAVVPGMSFDNAGNRLGRGKGYYDRFLRKLEKTYKLGICFDFQKVDNVPCDQYDIKMDEVL